jgi:hypothetical protein
LFKSNENRKIHKKIKLNYVVVKLLCIFASKHYLAYS